MVCRRCKIAVGDVLHQVGLQPLSVELGEVELVKEPTKQQYEKIEKLFHALGFELIDDRKSKIIERVKNLIITLIHSQDIEDNIKLSDRIASHLHQDYNTVSNLFSSVEGTTIEKYYILQRIERAKELLIYDEYTLSQIADQLGYSSVAYLSNQFKKITGFTPSHFKKIREIKRRNIEEL